MSAFTHGRHEFGQNFLTDPSTIATIVGLVADTSGPIIEIGSGAGALTLPIQKLGRPITAVEIDERHATRLGARIDPQLTTIVNTDFLRYRLPHTPHVLVGNLPFHQTTAILRAIVHAPGWTEAILLAQWEVARRRAGIGGATMMTAQWWPWYTFTLHRRIGASAFSPRPSVDAGLFTITRRSDPLLPITHRREYQAFVHRVFTGRGRGVTDIVTRTIPSTYRAEMRRTLATIGFGGDHVLPRDVSAQQWVSLFEVTRHRVRKV